MFSPNPFQIPVVPGLERERRRLSAAFFNRTLVAAAAGVRLGRVRFAVLDVDHPPVRHPARFARREVLVGIRDAPVMLLAILVLRRIRIRIPTPPEVLDERVPLLVVAQAQERFLLRIGNDPPDVLVQPFPVGGSQLVPQLLLLLSSLLIGQLPLQRILLVLLTLRGVLVRSFALALGSRHGGAGTGQHGDQNRGREGESTPGHSTATAPSGVHSILRAGTSPYKRFPAPRFRRYPFKTDPSM